MEDVPCPKCGSNHSASPALGKQNLRCAACGFTWDWVPVDIRKIARPAVAIVCGECGTANPPPQNVAEQVTKWTDVVLYCAGCNARLLVEVIRGPGSNWRLKDCAEPVVWLSAAGAQEIACPHCGANGNYVVSAADGVLRFRCSQCEGEFPCRVESAGLLYALLDGLLQTPQSSAARVCPGPPQPRDESVKAVRGPLRSPATGAWHSQEGTSREAERPAPGKWLALLQWFGGTAVVSALVVVAFLRYRLPLYLAPPIIVVFALFALIGVFAKPTAAPPGSSPEETPPGVPDGMASGAEPPRPRGDISPKLGERGEFRRGSPKDRRGG